MQEIVLFKTKKNTVNIETFWYRALDNPKTRISKNFLTSNPQG